MAVVHYFLCLYTNIKKRKILKYKNNEEGVDMVLFVGERNDHKKAR